MSVRNVFAMVFLFICLLGGDVLSRDYWGLRNINTRMPDSVYTAFDADYYAFAVSWARTEIENDEFTWRALDNSLDFAQEHGGKAVLVVSCNSRWACGGETRAPDDLDRRTPLNREPPENGYSESLYDFAYRLVDHIAQRENPAARHLRFVNEPDYNWEMGRNWERDVEDYARCLRTFYLGAHEAAAENGLEIFVSHGGFNLSRSLARKYYRLGEENEALQDSLIMLLQSRFERHANRVNDWPDVRMLALGRGGMPPTYWEDIMAGQTEWLDWFDVHYHFKPVFIFDELSSFEETVRDSGGELRPWLASEAAMQLAQGGLTEYEERFHAADMARKWIYGLAFGLEGICTPITGYPPEHFFGLFNDEQEEYLSAATYRFLRSIIQPLDEPEDLSGEMNVNFLFHEEMADIMVAWQRAYFDSREGVSYTLYVECAERYNLATIYSFTGEAIATVEQGADMELDIQNPTEPIIIVYERAGDVNNSSVSNAPQKFQLLSIYPNPFNSSATLKYSLPVPGFVKLSIFDPAGRKVQTNPEHFQRSGEHAIHIGGNRWSSGAYWVRLESGGSVALRQVQLVK